MRIIKETDHQHRLSQVRMNATIIWCFSYLTKIYLKWITALPRQGFIRNPNRTIISFKLMPFVMSNVDFCFSDPLQRNYKFNRNVWLVGNRLFFFRVRWGDWNHSGKGSGWLAKLSLVKRLENKTVTLFFLAIHSYFLESSLSWIDCCQKEKGNSLSFNIKKFRFWRAVEFVLLSH